MSFDIDRPTAELQPGCLFSYRVALPNQILIKTGWGVESMLHCKNCIQWPFQRVTVIDMNPRNYKFELQAMSSEMVPFKLPVVFTVGPVDPEKDLEGFRSYARTMAGFSEHQLTEIVAGVIHGQARVFSASLTIRDMFADRDGFKNNVQERIQKDMNHYGLYIYNANIAEMKDLDEHNKYFENLKQKALEGANTEMRVQVAEARKQGDIGEILRQGETKMQKAAIEANVAKNSNTQLGDIEKSNLDYALVKTQCKMQEETAKVAADFNVKQKQIELQTVYEKATATQQLEHLRAMELSKAQVEAEKLAKKAEGEAIATRTRADAQLYAETQQAEAVKVLRAAQAEGLRSIFNACADQPQLATFYLGMEGGLYEKLADKTAAAVQGMKPNINIWTTGPAGSDGDADGMGSMRKLFMGLPPMLDAVQQQTNIRLPAWMPQSAAPTQQQ